MIGRDAHLTVRRPNERGDAIGVLFDRHQSMTEQDRKSARGAAAQLSGQTFGDLPGSAGDTVGGHRDALTTCLLALVGSLLSHEQT